MHQCALCNPKYGICTTANFSELLSFLLCPSVTNFFTFTQGDQYMHMLASMLCMYTVSENVIEDTLVQ